jgi:hypothetical protein
MNKYKGVEMTRIAEERFGSYRMRNHSFQRTMWLAVVAGVRVVAATRREVAAKAFVARQWEAAGKPNGYDGLLAAYTEAGL